MEGSHQIVQGDLIMKDILLVIFQFTWVVIIMYQSLHKKVVFCHYRLTMKNIVIVDNYDVQT